MLDQEFPWEWQREIIKSAVANAGSSYGMVCVAATCLLLEHPDEPERWNDLLSNNLGGMSGFQASAAIAMARDLLKRAQRGR